MPPDRLTQSCLAARPHAGLRGDDESEQRHVQGQGRTAGGIPREYNRRRRHPTVRTSNPIFMLRQRPSMAMGRMVRRQHVDRARISEIKALVVDAFFAARERSDEVGRSGALLLDPQYRVSSGRAGARRWSALRDARRACRCVPARVGGSRPLRIPAARQLRQGADQGPDGLREAPCGRISSTSCSRSRPGAAHMRRRSSSRSWCRARANRKRRSEQPSAGDAGAEHPRRIRPGPRARVLESRSDTERRRRRADRQSDRQAAERPSDHSRQRRGTGRDLAMVRSGSLVAHVVRVRDRPVGVLESRHDVPVGRVTRGSRRRRHGLDLCRARRRLLPKA